jgi:hypothetical protein
MTKKRLGEIEKLLDSGKTFDVIDISMECFGHYDTKRPINEEFDTRIKKIQTKIDKLVTKNKKLLKEISKIPIGEVPPELAEEYMNSAKFLGITFPKDFKKALCEPLVKMQKANIKNLKSTTSKPPRKPK